MLKIGIFRFEGNPPAIPCMKPAKQCKPNPCGSNTECVVVNNVQRCTCKIGYREAVNTIQVHRYTGIIRKL